MSANTTREAIVDLFIRKTETHGLRGIHIAKLIKDLQINHNSFYYHFANKYDVALYVFRTDLARRLTDAFPEEELVYAPLSMGKTIQSLPFFIHREIGAHTLEIGQFMKTYIACLLSRPRFYRRLFDQAEQEFRQLFTQLYRQVIQDDLRFMLGGRYMPEVTFDFMTATTVQDIYLAGVYILHSRDENVSLLDDRINPFWNLRYESIVQGLQNHTINRLRK